MGDFNREFWLNDQPPAINAMRLNNVENGLDTVDSEMNMLPWKHAVRAASTVNIPSLSGLLTIDEVILVHGDKVLVKNQTTQSQNGIYRVNEGGAWSRSEDANTSEKIPWGMLTYVRSGLVNQMTLWVLVNGGNPTLGTTTISFNKLTLPQGYNLTMNGLAPLSLLVHPAGQTVSEFPGVNRGTFIADLSSVSQFRMIVNVPVAATPTTFRIRPQAWWGDTPSWQNLATPPAGEANLSTTGYRDTGWVAFSAAAAAARSADRFCRIVFEGGQPSTGTAAGQIAFFQIMFK